MNNVLLSIAIPTYNRAEWLQLCLSKLLPQVLAIGNSVEVTVYDNASPDDTYKVAQAFIDRKFPLSYYRNDKNIGSDKNIAQCFNRAKGRYVLILGDDDVFLDGSLQKIMSLLDGDDFGAAFVRAYGYDKDYLEERPKQVFCRSKIYSDANQFIKQCFIGATFISSLIINKSSLPGLDANRFVGTSLVQTYLFYEAIFSCSRSIYINEYLLAAKRTERKDYDVIGIFCGQYNSVLECFVKRGLRLDIIVSINRKLLWYFLPFHLLLMRKLRVDRGVVLDVWSRMKYRYKSYFLFWICAMPILKFPSKIALLWGYVLIFLGRLLNGELGRLWVAIREQLSPKAK